MEKNTSVNMQGAILNHTTKTYGEVQWLQQADKDVK